MQAPTTRIWLRANWPLAITAGTSLTPHPHADQGFTLSAHSALDEQSILKNRQTLAENTGLTQPWLWLKQTHSARVINTEDYQTNNEADALISREHDKVAVVLTADCLPILIANKNANEVAAIHAGWQGLYKQIIHATLQKTHAPRHTQLAWIGPCAGRDAYEVDEIFYQRFITLDHHYRAFFRPSRTGHYWADLSAIAKRQLLDAGLNEHNIYSANECSISNTHFFSHRRDGAKSGRMASFIAPMQKT